MKDYRYMYYDNNQTIILENLVNSGFNIQPTEIDFDKVLNLYNNTDRLNILLKNYFSLLVKEYSKLVGKLAFPLDILFSFYSSPVEEAFFHLLQIVSKNDVQINYNTKYNFYFTPLKNLNNIRERNNKQDDDSNLCKSYIANCIVDYLGKPQKISISPEDSEGYNLTYPIDKYEKITNCLKTSTFFIKPGTYSIVTLCWEGAFLEISMLEDGKIIYYNLEIDEAYKHIITSSLKYKAFLNLKNNKTFGNLSNSFSLNSFHLEAKELEKVVDDKVIDDNKKTCVLIQGKPGTGKTEWVKSYTIEKLASQGFFTYYLDATTIQNFSPDTNLPKICIIINEVDNLVKDRKNYTDDLGLSEALLSFFDGSIYNTVVPNEENLSIQQLVIFMTCNSTERMDPALLQNKSRIDVIHQFTHKY